MRIITGIARGCKLKSPKGLVTRPTADRVKESLFNILGSEVLSAQILDLFAGTGNLGLESLSRGAAHATFIDQNLESIHIIQENATHTKLVASSEIVKQDVFTALRRLDGMSRKFDLVFCDPPYQKGLAEKTLYLLDELSILREGAIIVIEHARDEALDLALKNIAFKCNRRYGATTISFFSMQGDCLAVTKEGEL